MDHLKLDLRFAVRSLSRWPGFTTACDDDRRRGRVRLAHALAASAAALLVVAPLAAMVPVAGDRVEVTAAAVPSAIVGQMHPRRDQERPQAICWGRNDDVRKLHVERERDSYLLEWETVGCEVEIRIRGEIGFNSDFTAIARIARGGSVRLIEEAGDRAAARHRAGSGGTRVHVARR